MQTEFIETVGTGELVRHALSEARALAKAEINHAKQELRDEVAGAKRGVILLAVATGLAATGLSAIVIALALLLPLEPALSVGIVAVTVLLIAGVFGWVGYRALPTEPLHHTRDRLALDVSETKQVFS